MTTTPIPPKPSSVPSPAQTLYTGDTLQGIPVISHLAIADLPSGHNHRFYFQGVQMGSGQPWHVPVVVAKGARPGPCIALVSGVHGDEVSGIDAVQRVMAQLDPQTMAGSVLAVLGVSRPALEYSLPFWPTAMQGGLALDMNRVWPGDTTGDNPVTQHAGLLWQRLLMPNRLEAAIDYHTITTGSAFTLFLFADLRQPTIRQMAELFPVDHVKDDPGLPGTLETALVEAGIPSLTVEIGEGRRFEPTKIARAVEGSLNLLKHYGLVPGPLDRTAADVGTLFGDSLATVRATAGGFLELLVELRDRVTSGQPVAHQRNAFGDVVATYYAPVAGEVAVVARDALCEPGRRIVQILHTQGGKSTRQADSVTTLPI